MKLPIVTPLSAFILAALLGTSLLLPTGPALATTYTWTGGGSDGNWTTTTNWQNSVPASSPDTALIFGGTSQLASNQNVGTAFALNSLAFNSGAGAFTLSGGRLDFFTNSASVLPTLTQNSASLVTINDALRLNSTLTVNGTGNLLLRGIIDGSASAPLVMAGDGTLTLTGNNTYTGGTTFRAGTVNVGGTGALGSSGTLSFTGGTLQYSAANTTDYSGRFSTAANQAYRVDTNGQNVTFGMALSSSGGSLAKLGTGTLTYLGMDTATGNTTVSGGTLAVTTGSITGGASFTVDSPAAGGTASVTLGSTSSTAGTVSANTVNVGVGGQGSFTQNGGTLTVANGNALNLGVNAGSTGAYTLNGGTLNTGYINVGSAGNGTLTQNRGTITNGYEAYVGSNSGGIGAWNQSAGSATVGATFYLGNGSNSQGTYNLSGTGSLSVKAMNVGNGSNSQGTYNLSGTGSLSAQVMYVGYSGSGTFNQSGGSVVLSGDTLNGSKLFLGQRAGSTGTYNLSGTGSLNMAGTMYVGFGGSGTFNQNGGSVDLNGDAMLIADGPNETGTYNLNGGTLKVGFVQGVFSASTFHFNGGTLQAAGNNSDFINVNTASVQAGGAKLDSNGYNITIAQNLVHDPALGNTADGGLTKTGMGTLTLTGTNTFTGPVVISAGTLAVASGANLGPAGGALAVTGGGQLLLTNSATLSRTYNLGVSTLGIGSGQTLTFGSGSVVNGGFLAGPGTDALGNGSTLNAVTAQVGSTLTQTDGGAATLNNATVRGTLTQTRGTLAVNNSTGTTSSRITVGGTVNTTGTELDGTTTINSGGRINTSGTSLYLGGGSRATINAGGTLSAASGTSIELNGAQLVNNGTQTGALNVNYGSTAKGSGTFGDVSVGDGGRFGANGVSGGGTNAAPGFSVIHLTSNGGLAATNPALMVGPQLSATPGTTNVGSLTLHGGGTFSIQVQNTTGAAGSGYDLTHASSTLTLAGDASPTNQITISLSSLNANGNPGAALNFDASRNYQFVLVQADTGILVLQW